MPARGVFILERLTNNARFNSFEEIYLPSIEPAEIYTDKAGPEILAQMYTFPDKKGRELCLRPEGTATVQLLADEQFKYQKDVKLYYATTCWRYERPQAGRYREFTQFGVEWLNPSDPVEANRLLIELATFMIKDFTLVFEVNRSVKRGLAYYTEEGFEISCPKLGAQKQVCGGGSYKQGCGFAMGVDRLMLL